MKTESEVYKMIRDKDGFVSIENWSVLITLFCWIMYLKLNLL